MSIACRQQQLVEECEVPTGAGALSIVPLRRTWGSLLQYSKGWLPLSARISWSGNECAASTGLHKPVGNEHIQFDCWRCTLCVPKATAAAVGAWKKLLEDLYSHGTMYRGGSTVSEPVAQPSAPGPPCLSSAPNNYDGRGMEPDENDDGDDRVSFSQGQTRRDTLHHVVAGATGGLIASFFISPFDVMRSRMAVQNMSATPRSPSSQPIKASSLTRVFASTFRNEGIRGIFRGLNVTLAVVPIFWGVYFSAYSYSKKVLSKHSNFSTPVNHMVASALSGGFADVVTNPLWLARTRLQTQHMFLERGSKELPRYSGVLSVLSAVYRQEGVFGLLRGLPASFLGLSHVMVQFPLYERLKVVVPEMRDHTTCTSLDIVICSIVSKSVACVVTYPHEVLRARLQYSAKFRGIRHCLVQTVRGEGWLALYQGLSANLVKTAPGCAITFVTYEYVLKLCDQLSRGSP